MSIDWPTEYIIKSRVWSIEYVDKDNAALSDGDGVEDYCLGICRADQRKIWVCTDQDDESMQDTLYHELVHACYSTASMAGNTEEAEDSEENIVLFATEAFFEIVRNATSDWWS